MINNFSMHDSAGNGHIGNTLLEALTTRKGTHGEKMDQGIKVKEGYTWGKNGSRHHGQGRVHMGKNCSRHQSSGKVHKEKKWRKATRSRNGKYGKKMKQGITVKKR